MHSHKVTFKVGEGGHLPERASAGAAGLDLRARSRVTLYPSWMRLLCMRGAGPSLVCTGVRWQAPLDLYMQIQSRSGLAVKRGVHVVAGTIDSDYRGIIQVALENRGLWPVHIEPGERIAQGVLHQLPAVHIVRAGESDELEPTERGAGGFGSTGSA